MIFREIPIDVLSSSLRFSITNIETTKYHGGDRSTFTGSLQLTCPLALTKQKPNPKQNNNKFRIKFTHRIKLFPFNTAPPPLPLPLPFDRVLHPPSILLHFVLFSILFLSFFEILIAVAAWIQSSWDRRT